MGHCCAPSPLSPSRVRFLSKARAHDDRAKEWWWRRSAGGMACAGQASVGEICSTEDLTWTIFSLIFCQVWWIMVRIYLDVKVCQLASEMSTYHDSTNLHPYYYVLWLPFSPCNTRKPPDAVMQFPIYSPNIWTESGNSRANQISAAHELRICSISQSFRRRHGLWRGRIYEHRSVQELFSKYTFTSLKIRVTANLLAGLKHGAPGRFEILPRGRKRTSSAERERVNLFRCLHRNSAVIGAYFSAQSSLLSAMATLKI